jgi:hypothetical protein
VLEHPDGFDGEVVVVENTQGYGTLEWPQANAEDPAQSAQVVVDHFAGLGEPVSSYLWDTIGQTSVGEYELGDMRDGYVIGPWLPATQIRVSYPKFQTAGGSYVSLDRGVWDDGAGVYADSLLTFLNVPVFKCHGYQYGVTGTTKHHAGTMTNFLATNMHAAVEFGGLGSFLVDVRLPDLNILDCICILARPSGGPWCPYGQATRLDMLVGGVDPIAIDMWSTIFIMVPTIIANGYSSYPMQDPLDPGSIFRTYLDRSMNEMLAAGIEVTNDPAQIIAHECSSTGVVAGAPAAPGLALLGASPNPATATTSIRFDLPQSGEVELGIFDVSGRRVRTISTRLAAGSGQAIHWDGRDYRGERVAAGVYLYRVQTDEAVVTGKVTIGR